MNPDSLRMWTDGMGLLKMLCALDQCPVFLGHKSATHPQHDLDPHPGLGYLWGSGRGQRTLGKR